MEEGEQDKSEPATPYKLMRAREKGAVARGVDLGFLAGLSAFLGCVWMLGPRLVAAIREAARAALIEGPLLTDGRDAALAVVSALFAGVVPLLALVAGAILLVVLLCEVIQTGVVFSARPLAPDFGRLSPAKGLKRLFSVRLLMETGKNIVKMAVYVGIGVLVIRGVLASDIGSVTDGARLFAVMDRAAVRLLSAVVLGALFVAVLDQLIVRRDFLGRMRMSRRELRREARDREGEPRVRQKRRQIHRELARASRSLRNVRKADVLIVNPRHIAIGLRYEPKRMPAPTVVAVGTGHLAQRLKRLAFVYGVPIVEHRLLAQTLLTKATLFEQIPDFCFRPVAARRRCFGLECT